MGMRTLIGMELTSMVFKNWMERNAAEWIRILKRGPQKNGIIGRLYRLYH